MDEELKKAWSEAPESSHEVVIVLRPESEGTPPEDLGLEDVQPIPYQPGMFKAKLTGAELLALAERSEVEGIDPDEEAHAL